MALNIKNFYKSLIFSIINFLSSFNKNYFLKKFNYQILLAKIKLNQNFCQNFQQIKFNFLKL